MFVQLGDGTSTDRNTPGTAVLTGAAAVAAGYGHTCALTIAGGVRCWGYNVFGQVRVQCAVLPCLELCISFSCMVVIAAR